MTTIITSYKINSENPYASYINNPINMRIVIHNSIILSLFNKI